MDINLSFERPPDGPGSGPVMVGWFLTEQKNAVLYDPPERVSSRRPNRSHSKSASRCPAVIQLESRYFVVKCPFDLHLGFRRDENGKPCITNLAGSESTIRSKKLGQVVTLVAESEWRNPDCPTIQLSLPYCFIADETVFLTQLSPFLHYRTKPLPGTIFGGRFPLNIWPRPLMWAFEWHEPEKEIVLKRGDPLFYCHFETMDPSRAVQLVAAELTPELQLYLDQIGGVVNYVNQTFGLFKAAEALRPRRLLVRKEQD